MTTAVTESGNVFDPRIGETFGLPYIPERWVDRPSAFFECKHVREGAEVVYERAMNTWPYINNGFVLDVRHREDENVALLYLCEDCGRQFDPSGDPSRVEACLSHAGDYAYQQEFHGYHPAFFDDYEEEE